MVADLVGDFRDEVVCFGKTEEGNPALFVFTNTEPITNARWLGRPGANIGSGWPGTWAEGIPPISSGSRDGKLLTCCDRIKSRIAGRRRLSISQHAGDFPSDAVTNGSRRLETGVMNQFQYLLNLHLGEPRRRHKGSLGVLHAKAEQKKAAIF